jgi:hypothetical protein
MRFRSSLTGATLALGLAACSDRLQVDNLNNPDVDRVYATAEGIEAAIAALGLQVNNPQRQLASINTQAKILAGENYATVANEGMSTRSVIPRQPIDNSVGNDNFTENRNNFNSFSVVSRTAANAIRALDRLVAGGGTLGSAAQNARARGFAHLVLGEALGYLSLGYDSAAIVTPALASDEIPGLSSAQDLNRAALRMIDTAIAIAQSAAATTGSNGFPLPATWINGRSDITRDNFVRLARSIKARLRAGVARTPAERGAVDWNAVIADALAGITTDHTIQVGGSSGWTATFDVSTAFNTAAWHQMPPHYFGMADVSGGYNTWLSQPLDGKVEFLVVTPDTRWPPGTTRAAQQSDAPTVALRPGRYVRNRPTGDDLQGFPWGNSFYDFRRWGSTFLNNVTGPYSPMTAAEIRLLAAEGYIRQGQFTQAAAIINETRVRNGLPAITGITSATQPIQTGPNCVPQVPQPPSFTSAGCGNILEAMKYEKRMETAYTGYLQWFSDSRGWGDLIVGTALEWPVPFEEMQARQQVNYNGQRVAVRGTYGF